MPAFDTVRSTHMARRPKIPNRLRELREGRGLKPYDLAAQLRVDQTTVSRWERGGPIPDHRKIQLADFFGCSIAEVMGWERPKRRSRPLARAQSARRRAPASS
jgi:ribosome-binding protein aMBF1 (putative translation factor)